LRPNFDEISASGSKTTRRHHDDTTPKLHRAFSCTFCTSACLPLPLLPCTRETRVSLHECFPESASKRTDFSFYISPREARPTILLFLFLFLLLFSFFFFPFISTVPRYPNSRERARPSLQPHRALSRAFEENKETRRELKEYTEEHSHIGGKEETCLHLAPIPCLSYVASSPLHAKYIYTGTYRTRTHTHHIYIYIYIYIIYIYI